MAYRRDIDGLRAIAILLVVLFHYEVPLFAAGYVGVDIFFVISGFLITGILRHSIETGRFRYRDFYLRRARRLIPALFCVVIVTTLVACLILTPYELKIHALTAAATLTGVSNIAFLAFTDYFSPKAVRQLLLMGWSLSVEMQFYLVIPPFILFGLRRGGDGLRRIVLVATLLSFAATALTVHYRPVTAFYLMPFRLWEIGTGSLIALGWSFGRLIRRRAALFPTAALLLGLALFLPPSQPVLVRQVLAVAAAGLIVMPGASGLGQGLLASAPMVGLGRVSYSWYLWHWPPVAVVHILGIEVGAAVRGGLILGTLLIAVATYHFVEIPFRRGGGERVIAARRYVVLWGAGIGSLFLIFVSGGMARWAAASVRQVDADVRSAIGNDCLVAYGATAPRSMRACLPSGTGAAIALIGDSHANALVAGIEDMASARSLSLYQMTKSSCQPILGYDHFLANHPTHSAECAAFLAEALAIVRTHPRIRTVILAGYWSSLLDASADGGEDMARRRLALEAGLGRMIDTLKRLGRTVIVVQDIPRFSADPHSMALNDLMPVRTSLARVLGEREREVRQDRMPWQAVMPDHAREAIARQVAQRPGVMLFDPVPPLCDPSGCLFRDGKRRVFYADMHHLSTAGAIYTARRLAGVQSAFEIPRSEGRRRRRVPSEMAMQYSDRTRIGQVACGASICPASLVDTSSAMTIAASAFWIGR
ncbi:acyltransferase family protein [Sphingomonas sp. GM_Shp_1]|uniref:acyltransferase family protein n=1 Tax=Sphingomonas sp. GM_Shp_1 TaxID=2937381 RepID=UPI00226B2FD2